VEALVATLASTLVGILILVGCTVQIESLVIVIDAAFEAVCAACSTQLEMGLSMTGNNKMRDRSHSTTP
jgi:hypothetical protein